MPDRRCWGEAVFWLTAADLVQRSEEQDLDIRLAEEFLDSDDGSAPEEPGGH